MGKSTLRTAGIVLGALSLAVLGACSQGADKGAEGTAQDVSQTVSGVIGGNGDLSMVAAGIEKAGLASMFDGPASYTILAPTDEALKNTAGAEGFFGKDGDGALMAAFLREHFVSGAMTPEAIMTAIDEKGGPVTTDTFGKGSITFRKDGKTLIVTGPDGAEARITDDAIFTENGVVIPLDGLLLDIPQ